MTWFGNIPAHWSTPPVYARYEVQLGKMLDERQITRRFLAPYLRNTDVQWDTINVEDLPEMDFDESEQESYALRPGDILMCEGGEIGRCAIWNGDRRCFYQKALHRLRPTTDQDDPRYFVLVMRAAVEAGLFTSRASAATIQHLPAEKLRVLRYPAPPIEEQRAIVNRVSRQTAWLDSLVAAKQRVLDLLAEKRKAIIATAVTRGLDPKVKLRDSGVPWLGKIPKHWEVSRLKFEATHIIDCLHATPPYAPDGEFPAIRTADVEPGRLLLQQARRLRLEDYRRWTERLVPIEGDILYTREGERFGIAANVPADVRLCISQRMMVFRIRPDRNSTYFMWQLNSPGVYQQASEDQLGAAAPHVNVEKIQNFWLLVPPLNEQDAIVEHIARATTKLDAMRAAIERTIALLKERRAALITAAVTGQLEVTSVPPPSGAA